MNSKLLICTRADDRIKSWTDLTHPRIKRLAEKCGADFCILDSEQPLSTHYRILDLYDLFEKYDRILHLDSDMIVLNRCPDPFKEVPEDKIGTIYEDLGSRSDDRHLRIQEIQHQFGTVGWTDGYINTGFFMTSKMHRDMFRPIDGQFWQGFGWDDVHLGYQIHRLGFQVYEMHWKWNAMGMFFEDWNGRPDKFTFGVNIMHYAGHGSTKEGIAKKAEEIRRDLQRFEKNGSQR